MDDATPVMEPRAERLRRFEQGPPIEVLSTLLNSINNFFNPEIARAAEAKCWSLMLIGTHAVALTISEALFGLSSEPGYSRFLREFIDGSEGGADFSSIGPELHQWRNVLAHQWLSSAGHRFAFDTAQLVGWEYRADLVVVNPERYHAAYRQAFSTQSILWRPDRLLTTDELQVAKARLIDKYVRR